MKHFIYRRSHYSCLHFTQVVRSKLAGPDFVWFIPGWFRANWWTAVDGNDCSAEEMKTSLEHTLGGLGNSLLDYDPDRVLVSKKVPRENTVVTTMLHALIDCSTI